MPRILIVADRAGVVATTTMYPNEPLHVEVITISEIDGIYTLRCTGDQIDACPSNVESGDTWSNFEDCVAEGLAHVGLHERRVCPACAGLMRVEYGHDSAGEFTETRTCQSCGATEARQ